MTEDTGCEGADEAKLIRAYHEGLRLGDLSNTPKFARFMFEIGKVKAPDTRYVDAFLFVAISQRISAKTGHELLEAYDAWNVGANLKREA